MAWPAPTQERPAVPCQLLSRTPRQLCAACAWLTNLPYLSLCASSLLRFVNRDMVYLDFLTITVSYLIL